jgi:hypothetical protein
MDFDVIEASPHFLIAQGARIAGGRGLSHSVDPIYPAHTSHWNYWSGDGWTQQARSAMHFNSAIDAQEYIEQNRGRLEQ